jgi:hypothetical protein
LAEFSAKDSLGRFRPWRRFHGARPTGRRGQRPERQDGQRRNRSDYPVPGSNRDATSGDGDFGSGGGLGSGFGMRRR